MNRIPSRNKALIGVSFREFSRYALPSIVGMLIVGLQTIIDGLFVIRFNWGVSGAAVATCIANTTAALVLLPNVRFGKVKGGFKEVKKMFFNGSSEMLTSVSAAVTTYIFNLVLMREIGTKGVAAFTIVCYLNFIVNMSIFGLSQAMYPLVSFSVGAKDFRKNKSLLANALLLGGGIGVGVYLLVLVSKHGIATAFSNGDMELQALTMVATTYVTLHYLVSFFNIVACSFHTAIERPLESVIIALCRSIVFVLLPMLVLTPVIGQTGIWLSMPIAEVLTLLVSVPLTAVSLRQLRQRT